VLDLEPLGEFEATVAAGRYSDCELQDRALIIAS